MAAAALFLLGVAWLVGLAPPMALLGSQPALLYNEGWNTVKQQEVLDGLRLYRDAPGLTLTNYPPLSYYVVAGFAAVSGLPLLEAGRLVSLGAFLACCWLVAVAAARLGSGRAGAVAAGLSFGIIGAAIAPRFVGANEPHFLGLAFTLAGLVLHLGPRGPRFAAAALCFAAALAVKFCFVGVPLAIAADLALRREWQALGRYILLGGLAVAGFAAWALLGEGPYALSQLFGARELSLFIAANNLALSLAALLPLGLATALALLDGLRDRPPRAALLAALVALPWPVAVFFAAGYGVAPAIFLEPIALTLVAFFAAFGATRRSGPPLPGSLGLLLPASAAAAVVFTAAWDHLMSRPERERFAALRNEALALVAAAPGPAMCEDILLCLQAGKPHVYDAYAVDNAIRAGQLDAERVARLFREHHFTVVQLGVDFAVQFHRPGRLMRFAPPLASAIRAGYAPVLEHPRLLVLVARP